ncbi:MAG TPA: 2-C-methyl-D-erythritol 2,4-cyclodiphosphate synthase [Steroidobacteraceae bacterium]|nr:2-C-methyl-D-erythritol 2,4-cyclodiphosphate synthase [Steroidobacteraceae bacterium]
MRYWLVMPAAGSGSRFAADFPKQYAVLAGRTVIEWALAPFLADPRCAHAVVVLAEGDARWPEVAARLGSSRVSSAPGGGRRSESVRSGLAALRERLRDEDWVVVHDAARPCLEPADLERLITRAGAHECGGLLAVPAADSLKRSAPGEAAVAGSVERAGLWRALTPQMFRYGRLCAALDAAHARARYPGDEAQALEWLGATALLVEGAATNVKITTPADLELAAALLRARGARPGEAAMRIGSGVDVHAFGPGEFLMLGGVRIPHSRGVIAHSDGDVVLHALCDALLGGAGLGDIGEHFPDTDPRWRGADSRRFVAAVLELLRARGLAIENADLTVIAQAPKIAPYREAMRREVAALLGIALERVSIKATTTEGLGFLGRAEGIAAQAVVLLAGA